MLCLMLSKRISFIGDSMWNVNCLLVPWATENEAGDDDDALSVYMQVLQTHML